MSDGFENAKKQAPWILIDKTISGASVLARVTYHFPQLKLALQQQRTVETTVNQTKPLWLLLNFSRLSYAIKLYLLYTTPISLCPTRTP